MAPIEHFALLFDALVVVIVVAIVRRVRRSLKPLPLDNYRPGDDDARSGRRITLFIYPKKGNRRDRTY